MKIRKAKKSDIKRLVKLDKSSNKEINKWWSQLVSSEFSRLIKRSLVYVAKQNNEIIAYLNGDIKDKELILDNIYAEKSCRQRGVAKRLI